MVNWSILRISYSAMEMNWIKNFKIYLIKTTMSY